MNEIKVLPPELVSKIAAGEVIERPASVIKELVENSLDAGALSVEAEIRDSGKTYLRVKDDGCGIPEQGLAALGRRHATSKISTADDLSHISSLGFRGEALYSITAVSDVIIRSNTASQECGWELHMREGKHLSRKPFPMGIGTEIEVRELFFNTPARRKFLKAHAAETSACLDTFLPYALLHADKRFTFINDGRVMLSADTGQTQKARIARALALEEQHLIEEQWESREHRLGLHFVLGDINITRTRKDLQFIFVNGRPVFSKTISFHLNDIYRLLLEPGVFPFFFINVQMDPDEIDVNVHPAKREIKIRDESALVTFLRRIAERLLMTRSQAKQASQAIFTAPAQEEHSAAATPSLQPAHPAPGFTAEKETSFSFPYAQPAEKGDLRAKLNQARFIGALLRSFLLFETPGSMLLIDQHAAQERINFEKLSRQFARSKVEVQPLLTPYLVRLNPQELLAWESQKERIETLGFSCSLFDQTTLAIHSHPHLITKPEQSMRNLLAGEPLQKLDPETLARMACRSSVMAGDFMGSEQAENQRKELLACEAPFTCPHGRPTVIEIPETAIRSQFLR
jgi:DNA mismatch repair protein MutL